MPKECYTDRDVFYERYVLGQIRNLVRTPHLNHTNRGETSPPLTRSLSNVY